MTALCVGGGLGGIQVLRLAFRIESPAAEGYRFSLGVKHRENQPAAKTIVRAAFIFPDHQPALFQLLLRRAFLSQMRRKRFPTVGSESEFERSGSSLQ